jgi:hypothetical protein
MRERRDGGRNRSRVRHGGGELRKEETGKDTEKGRDRGREGLGGRKRKKMWDGEGGEEG